MSDETATRAAFPHSFHAAFVRASASRAASYDDIIVELAKEARAALGDETFAYRDALQERIRELWTIGRGYPLMSLELRDVRAVSDLVWQEYAAANGIDARITTQAMYELSARVRSVA